MVEILASPSPSSIIWLRSEAVISSSTTWYFKTVANWSWFSLIINSSIVASSTFSKALLVGAKTVYGPSSSVKVSAKSAFCNALTRVLKESVSIAFAAILLDSISIRSSSAAISAWRSASCCSILAFSSSFFLVSSQEVKLKAKSARRIIKILVFINLVFSS